jgi:anti-sigma factor RsiW
MNQNHNHLKIQAYVDGQLDAAEAADVKAWIDSDSEASELAQSLQSVSNTLMNNELGHKLPESVEFYWSKIEREIGAEEATLASSTVSIWTWGRLVRWIAPALAVASVAVVLVHLKLSDSEQDTGSAALAFEHEIEFGTTETSYISFRSEKEGMSVVWLESRGE